MKYLKKRLVGIAEKVIEKRALSPEEMEYLLSFEKLEKEQTWLRVLKKLTVPLSLLFGFFFTVFPMEFEQFSLRLPGWTNFNPPLLAGINYFWDLLGDPVKKANIVYHIPNIILYSFGVVGIKKVMDLMDRRTWLDKVIRAQAVLQENVKNGLLNLRMRKGHSLLFVGRGDFIGMQQSLNCRVDETVTISQVKPAYTNIWNYYDVETLYEDLKEVIIKSDGKSCGEYVFFLVKDDQIFLPGPTAYDLSPHKVDLLVQNIRVIEKELKWKAKKIVIIGDKFHQSFVHSEDQIRVVPKSDDIISLSSITEKYPEMTLIDPSDVVLEKIIKIAGGRKIVFRATISGIKEYKKRFYERLKQLGYKQKVRRKGILTIGYDIFEDQTEQQTLSRKIDDYYPVVLSKSVRDALIRNGYKSDGFLYVPDLVIETLIKIATDQ
jgi:hypothetical protein